FRCSFEGRSSKSRLATRSVASKPSSQIFAQNIVLDDLKATKRIMFDKAELSVSSYDTAWVAMVSATSADPVPYFPNSVNWILENQRLDGSWGHNQDPLLMKDTLSSTLACVLALKRWGIGDQHVQNALGFMERNSVYLNDPTQQTPIGFDVTFPAMIQTSVKDFNLNLPLNSADVDAMIRNRESILNNSANPRSKGRDAYLAYISEGIGDQQDWETAIKFQRSNGSLFNSPSATAAAFIHLQDPDSLRYLRSVVDVNSAVPAIYPHGIQARLCQIDAAESLGINRHFGEEIRATLDEIYRCWQQGDEEIFLDPTTCAMAFRILRLNRYPVSSYVFDRFTEDRFWNDTLEGFLKDERAVLEMHKASKVIYQEDSILEQQQLWTRQFLVKLLDEQSSDSQVLNVLSYPFRSDLEPVAHKRNIEQFWTQDNTRVLKSSFSCLNSWGKDIAELAVGDFNSLQSSYLNELQHLMLWLEEKGLDEMRLAKVRMGYCYFSAAATFSDPDHSDARILFSKHALLVSLVDDLFDMFGTHEELLNIVHLFENWDVNAPSAEFSSELVETLYWAIHSTICENVEKAFPFQGRSIMDHLVELWVEMLQGMLKEAEWSKTNTVPTLEEYSTNATITLGVGAFLVPALYLAGHELPERVVKGPKFQHLFTSTSNCGRLLNDSRGFEREAEQGKPNAVLLRIGNETTEKEAIEEVDRIIENLTREVLELALDDEGFGEVPSDIRDMFWRSVQVFYLFYMKEDLYHASTKLVKVVDSVINEPINLDSIDFD
ncbi:Ent-kaur-16-ene synthase, chloroplastic, partial [Linum perenne]